jgi:AraC family transcriptional regulator
MDNWDNVNAVQRMQDYIESHICEPITLHSLSRAAGYSPWHSARIFRELTGKAPFDYIRSFRLSKAALLLRDDSPRIIDVALNFVFDSHEGFTRAFSREFGLSPKHYRKMVPPIKLFLPKGVSGNYLTIREGAINMSQQEKSATVFVQVIERPARRLIIRRGIHATDYYEYCEEVGCDIWNILTSVKDALYEPIGLWLPPSLIQPGTSVYAQGVEVAADYSGTVPADCDLVDLPPCKMMVFQGQPYDDENFEAAITNIWSVMQDYHPEIYGYRWADDDGPRFQLIPLGYRGYIEARPVRAV